MDLLTYAGNLENLKDIEYKENYSFVKCDICDFKKVKQVFVDNKIDSVIHLAAESHVDRSIGDPFSFAKTNIMGTLSLLQVAKEFWNGNFLNKLFYHVSTDEVYGSLGKEGFFTETTNYDPHSPYSASKASSDHFVRAFHDTYGLPIVISNCSNNYGSYQFPEKLIPLFISNIINNKSLPVYGNGENVRDWLYVNDHTRAIDVIFHSGKLGETYNIGGFNEWKNIDLIKVIIKTVDRLLGRKEGTSNKLITYVKDRAGHDLRYAIDSSKLKNELGWEPSLQFEEGIEKTVKWYLDNKNWMDRVTSGDYKEYYKKMYN
jgi:dTDP-glucose 4,6-dehydratase